MAKDETERDASEQPPAEARATTQEYLVLVKIGGAGDPEVFLPGSRITLDDDQARPHLLGGNIQALDHATPPPTPVTVQVVHDAPLPRTRRATPRQAEEGKS